MASLSKCSGVITGMSYSTAVRSTGDGCTVLPLPERLAGRVHIRASSIPASMIARMDGNANVGVPKKTALSLIFNSYGLCEFGQITLDILLETDTD